MSVAKIVRDFVDNIDAGVLFSYDDIPTDRTSVAAIELSRLGKQGKLKRIGRGKYYKPLKGYFGELPVSDAEVLRAFTAPEGSYITGLKAFNEMGLTTQVPRTIAIATDKQPRKIRIKNLEIQFVPIRQKVPKNDVHLIQILDALESLRKIPGSTPDDVVNYVRRYVRGLSTQKAARLGRYASKYRPRTRAVAGAILEAEGYGQFTEELRTSLNPLSSYRAGVSDTVLPNQKSWQIR